MKSDYRYSAQVARQEAERALDDADWVTSRLTSIPDREFKSLPLAPQAPTARSRGRDLFIVDNHKWLKDRKGRT